MKTTLNLLCITIFSCLSSSLLAMDKPIAASLESVPVSYTAHEEWKKVQEALPGLLLRNQNLTVNPKAIVDNIKQIAQNHLARLLIQDLIEKSPLFRSQLLKSRPARKRFMSSLLSFCSLEDYKEIKAHAKAAGNFEELDADTFMFFSANKLSKQYEGYLCRGNRKIGLADIADFSRKDSNNPLLAESSRIATLKYFFIDERVRRAGLGSRFLTFILKQLADKECGRVFARIPSWDINGNEITQQGNGRALKRLSDFFKNRGFTPISEDGREMCCPISSRIVMSSKKGK